MKVGCVSYLLLRFLGCVRDWTFVHFLCYTPLPKVEEASASLEVAHKSCGRRCCPYFLMPRAHHL